MPTKKMFSREEAARLIENDLKKFAGAVRNSILEGAMDWDALIKENRVWQWLASAHKIFDQIKK